MYYNIYKVFHGFDSNLSHISRQNIVKRWGWDINLATEGFTNEFLNLLMNFWTFLKVVTCFHLENIGDK